MEINITALMNRRSDMKYYSASQAEIGSDAGRITWENALDCAEESPLVTPPEQLAEVRDYLREFGAWDDEEIDETSDTAINATLLQLVAGDIRERAHYEDEDRLDEYEENHGGRIYSGNNGDWWYYVGN